MISSLPTSRCVASYDAELRHLASSNDTRLLLTTNRGFVESPAYFKRLHFYLIVSETVLFHAWHIQHIWIKSKPVRR